MSTTTPNMNLIVPTVGVEIGPDYASELNGDLSTIDGHNHTSGMGVPIPTSGLNINADLSFGGFNATNFRSVRFQNQSGALVGPSDLGCIYENGGDFYYNNSVGVAVQITSGSSIVGTAGSISGLPSGTASAAYISGTGTFRWQSSTNTAANLDARNIVLRNATALSFGLTLSPPAAIGSNFTLVLPTIPGVQSFMTLDASGNMAAPWTVDGTTIQIIANQLVATAFAPTAPSIQRFTSTGTTSGFRFTLNAGYSLVAGDTYTNSGHTYTVPFSTSSANTGLMTGTSSPASSGTLTRATGTGPVSVVYTSNQAFATYTRPTPSPLYLEPIVVGGGGGGASGGGAAGGAGGTSFFIAADGSSEMLANGGSGGSGSTGVISNGGGSSIGGASIIIVATGGSGTARDASINYGGAGGNNPLGGGGGSATTTGGAGAANTGGGGGGADNAGSSGGGAGGGAGGYAQGLISTPVTTYYYAVGSGGSGGGAAGGSGVVTVREAYQ